MGENEPAAVHAAVGALAAALSYGMSSVGYPFYFKGDGGGGGSGRGV